MDSKRDGMVIMMKGYFRMSIHKHVSSLVYMIKKVRIQMVMTRDDIVQIWIFEALCSWLGGITSCHYRQDSLFLSSLSHDHTILVLVLAIAISTSSEPFRSVDSWGRIHRRTPEILEPFFSPLVPVLGSHLVP